MRLIPRSLMGQTLLAAALALVVAQAISAVLLYRAGEQRRDAALLNAIAFQFVAAPEREARQEGRQSGERRALRPQRGTFPRRLRYRVQDTSPLLPGEERFERRERALGEILASQGIRPQEVVLTTRAIEDDPFIAQAGARFPRLQARLERSEIDTMIVAGLKRSGAAQWEVVRIPAPPQERRILGTLFLQTVLLVLVLTLLLWLILRRITRPLARLAQSTTRFAGAGAPEPPLAPSGPQDVRDLIEAQNAMQARIGAMLDEKDVMLGAIGHDLKTPLAALRVRIESVEDESARGRMAATIEDITSTLDDILHLARVGRSDAPLETVELGALAASVVSEFEDLGEAARLQSSSRVAAPVRLTWLKRALRNLISNALRYGASATVTVTRMDDMAVLRVEDEGPGIPEDRLAEMMEPFARGEASRNRTTGGAGLGLAIARAVAEQHGGSLTLSNRSEGGLAAEIRLPL